jgi:hypothetical protein
LRKRYLKLIRNQGLHWLRKIHHGDSDTGDRGHRGNT